MTDGFSSQQKRKDRKWLSLTAYCSLPCILFFFGWIPRMINEKKIDALAAEKDPAKSHCHADQTEYKTHRAHPCQARLKAGISLRYGRGSMAI